MGEPGKQTAGSRAHTTARRGLYMTENSQQGNHMARASAPTWTTACMKDLAVPRSPMATSMKVVGPTTCAMVKAGWSMPTGKSTSEVGKMAGSTEWEKSCILVVMNTKACLALHNDAFIK